MKSTGAKRNVCPGSCLSTGAKFPVALVESAPMSDMANLLIHVALLPYRLFICLTTQLAYLISLFIPPFSFLVRSSSVVFTTCLLFCTNYLLCIY